MWNKHHRVEEAKKKRGIKEAMAFLRGTAFPAETT